MAAFEEGRSTRSTRPVVHSVSELRARFREGKAALLAHFATSRPTAPAATRLLRALAKQVDQTLLDLWRHAGMPAGCALLAVGGYGRSELFPHSDVDVLVLMPGDALTGDNSRKTSVEAFITACWDIGLEIGSSVRTLNECAVESQRDVTVQTALLESRLISGARKLFAEFQRETQLLMDPKIGRASWRDRV